MLAAGGAGQWGGTRATYVALSAVTILGLATLLSIWHSDVSGSLALLGLLSIYLSSSELLVLFYVFLPVSIIVDIIRISGSAPAARGRGWLIFFTIAEILAKGAGTLFGWSLHRSLSAGGGDGGGSYQPINTAVGGGQNGRPGGAGGGGGNAAYAAPQGGVAADDPFANAYAPPRVDAHGVPPVSSYQPFPTTSPHGV